MTRWRTVNKRHKRKQRRLYVTIVMTWGTKKTKRRIRLGKQFRSYSQFFDGIKTPEEVSIGYMRERPNA